MIKALVSIILPVYNCEAYLDDAISSILSQDYADLELIVIDDGSNDSSAKIIKGYETDKRVRFVQNNKNEGLIYTLNRGIDLARGEYIARMDGDDISLPERISSQVAYLQLHKNVSVVATRIRLVDEAKRDLGIWKEEYERITPSAIRSYLRWNNCIAHPTVMIRSEDLKLFRYEPRQKLSEDYDLWLRMAAAGKVISKLESVGLLHRILSNSFTRTRSYNPFTRMSIVKWQFVTAQLRKRKINGFILSTAITALLYRVAGSLKSIKKKLSK